MATFRDADGRDWRIRLTVGSMPKLKDVGLDIAETVKTGSLDVSWMRDFGLVARALWVLVERQAAERKVTPEQFAEALDGPTIHAATLAYAEALADFSLPPDVAAEVRQTIPAVDERTQQSGIGHLRSLIGSNAEPGNSPGSPASTLVS